MGQENKQQDELEFDIGEDEQEATVDMNEDGSEAKLVEEEKPEVEEEEKPEKSEEKQAAPNSEELDNYSEKVQKRIDKLTARLREHQRREEAAIEYAKSVQQTNEQLQKQYAQTNTERMGEAKGRIDTQILSLKSVIKKAKEEGDIETETEAQQRLTQAIWEKNNVEQAERQAKSAPAQESQRMPEELSKPVYQVDEKAEEWAERNPWFGKNIVMTRTVEGVHTELVKNEGFDPTSDEYYDEIDRRMRNIFPQAFQPQQSEEPAQTNRSNRPVQTVAPATRSSGVNSSARRTIKLKPSEVAIAKKLGVPLEEYAKFVKR